MASKINTDNPKHHKYVDTNKYERKKNKKNIKFDFIHKIYDVSVLVRTIIESVQSYKTSYLFYKITHVYSNTYKSPNYHSHHHYNYNCTNSIKDRVGKGCLVIWNDCNHRTFRVKKRNNFISKYYMGKPTIFKFK